MSSGLQTVPLQTLASLQQVGRDIPLPFALALPDGTSLHCSQVLRVMPGKRLVVRATHQGETVLAKLFFSDRHWQQELDGFSLLNDTGVITPTLLSHHHVPNNSSNSGGVCLYEFIDSAIPLDLVWQTAREASKAALFDLLLPLLQRCYQHHVLQQDLHLGNFLLSGNMKSGNTLKENPLIVLDPASCSRFTQATEQQDNLALLLAQLPFTDWPMALEKICAHFPSVDNAALAKQAQQQWRQRERAYLQKIRRDCTEVADISQHGLRILCRRDQLNEAMAARLGEPSALHTHATVLKNGNSAKVFLLDIDGKKIVAKQYINKDWLRKIRRAFRPSRAARSWHIAHALAFAGITVPAPIALVEQKFGPLVTCAWYLCEFMPGRDLLASWKEREPTDGELETLQALFVLLQRSGISHGDMKATNLITDGEHLALIDYDGARQHAQQKTLVRALATDKQRFLQNWADKPVLQKRLADLLNA